MTTTPLVQLTERELSLLVRGLRAVEQQTITYPDENREAQVLRRRLASLHAQCRGGQDV